MILESFVILAGFTLKSRKILKNKDD